MRLLLAGDKLGDAQVHVGRSKSHVVTDPYGLGRTVLMQAGVWCEQFLRIISGCEKIAVSVGFFGTLQRVPPES